MSAHLPRPILTGSIEWCSGPKPTSVGRLPGFVRKPLTRLWHTDRLSAPVSIANVPRTRTSETESLHDHQHSSRARRGGRAEFHRTVCSRRRTVAVIGASRTNGQHRSRDSFTISIATDSPARSIPVNPKANVGLLDPRVSDGRRFARAGRRGGHRRAEGARARRRRGMRRRRREGAHRDLRRDFARSGPTGLAREQRTHGDRSPPRHAHGRAELHGHHQRRSRPSR